MAGLTLSVTALISGCQDEGEKRSDKAVIDTKSAEAKIEVSVPDGTKDVSPESVITVKALDGEIGTVTVASEDGKRSVDGKVGDDKKVWSSQRNLAPKTTYKVTATARSKDGQESTSTTSFTTLTAKKVIGYTVTPDGWTVGAGMPVQVKFNAPITTPEAKAQIESQMSITASPSQPGSWGWTNDRTLLYRPQTYWTSGTKIEVKAPLAGTKIAPDTYLAEDNGAKLTIGTQRVLKVDLAAYSMTLIENGQTVKSFAISGGRAGERFETRAGTKVIQDKHPDIVMDSSTFGVGKSDPEYYRTKVQWALRITDSGEFLHSAPWSVGQQGKANVSHGCVNMAPGDAEWLFGKAQYGDVVETVNSNYQLKPEQAGIPVWLWTWEEWQTKSAVNAVGSSEGPMKG
ncbi:L,D-transpeptidase [Austwickia chelonae]|uniref:L,D-transpeptidase n=1 Tax=Austwickia chelonae TaxID=100225 RepID=UPI0013C2BA56|nr:Ig-like domain-containing protein [Austwickia chelonae]